MSCTDRLDANKRLDRVPKAPFAKWRPLDTLKLFSAASAHDHGGRSCSISAPLKATASRPTQNA